MKLLKLIEKHFAPILFSFGLLGFLFPKLFSPITDYAYVFLMLNLFLGFLRVDLSQIASLKQSFLSIVIKSVISVILIPLAVYVLTLGLTKEMRIGLFLLASACGGTSVPLFSGLLGFNVLKGGIFVVITSTIIVFSVPYLLSVLYASTASFDKVEMGLFLLKVVILPSSLGIIVKKFVRETTVNKVSSIAPWMGTINLALLLGAVIAGKRDTVADYFFSSLTLYGLIGMFLVFLLRFFVGYLMEKNYKERWGNGLMFVITNNGLMILLALQFFSAKEVWVCMLSYIPWTLTYPIIRRLYKKS